MDTSNLDSVALSVVSLPNLFSGLSPRPFTSGLLRFTLQGSKGASTRRRLGFEPEYAEARRARRLTAAADDVITVGRVLMTSGILNHF
jgi:hypothetical protein